MCKRIGAPNVKVHLDVYHMNIEESDIQQAILDTGDYLGYFHTGDSHRGYMGSGSIDLAGVFRALVKSGYTGTDHLRVLLVPGRRPAARRHSRHLAQPVGGQPRPRLPCADVYQGAAQGGARGPETGRAQPSRLIPAMLVCWSGEPAGPAHKGPFRPSLSCRTGSGRGAAGGSAELCTVLGRTADDLRRSRRAGRRRTARTRPRLGRRTVVRLNTCRPWPSLLRSVCQIVPAAHGARAPRPAESSQGTRVRTFREIADLETAG